MPNRDRILFAGRRRAERARQTIGEALETRRLNLGLSLEEVSAAIGVSRDRLRRWELSRGASISVSDAAVALRMLGADLAISTFPTGGALRDAGHAKLIARFLDRLPPVVRRELEAPIPFSRDLRAWDVLLHLPRVKVGVAAETRLRDGQELVRRERQKARDGDVPRLLLVLNDSTANRRAVAQSGGWLDAAFPARGRTVWAALRALRDPGADGLLFI